MPAPIARDRLDEAQSRFARRAAGRAELFVALSAAGVAVAVGLTVWYGWRRAVDPTFPLGARVVIVLLILLNARQNLRQARYARVLRRLLDDSQCP